MKDPRQASAALLSALGLVALRRLLPIRVRTMHGVMLAPHQRAEFSICNLEAGRAATAFAAATVPSSPHAKRAPREPEEPTGAVT